ncbi:hypothetical protein GH714_004713 [Hevea brasiliensis]|uniref:Retrotransposon gag domain-containing protein n=1 Tax=Hevea brasiliensis TaxID=3981 RepID=A0A6A6MYY4_HEVBR|nr:hypothetical protein GH714_004713 [Hevea brasiliensis]
MQCKSNCLDHTSFGKTSCTPATERNGPRQGRGDDDEEPGVDEGAYDQHLPRHPHGQRDNIKMKIPTFRGTSSPEEYLEWIQRVDKIFEYQEYSEAKKCKLAAIEFVDYASLWWENVKAQRHRNRLDDVQTWCEIKRIMEKRFDMIKLAIKVERQRMKGGYKGTTTKTFTKSSNTSTLLTSDKGGVKKHDKGESSAKAPVGISLTEALDELYKRLGCSIIDDGLIHKLILIWIGPYGGGSDFTMVSVRQIAK